MNKRQQPVYNESDEACVSELTALFEEARGDNVRDKALAILARHRTPVAAPYGAEVLREALEKIAKRMQEQNGKLYGVSAESCQHVSAWITEALAQSPTLQAGDEVALDASQAFEEFAAKHDHFSNEWLDMDVKEFFEAGFTAALTKDTPAPVSIPADAPSELKAFVRNQSTPAQEDAAGIIRGLAFALEKIIGLKDYEMGGTKRIATEALTTANNWLNEKGGAIGK